MHIRLQTVCFLQYAWEINSAAEGNMGGSTEECYIVIHAKEESSLMVSKL